MKSTLPGILRLALSATLALHALPAMAAAPLAGEFDVLAQGAKGDGVTYDGTAIQSAIDAAAKAGGGRVRIPGGHRYLIGTLELRDKVDLHLEENAELLVSTDRAHYKGDGVIVANGASGVRITGKGKINGRAKEFMTSYDQAGEWWVPAEWRPKMFLLTACVDLEVRDITFFDAPQWGLHMLGCRNVLVDGLKIRNMLDVPNCDGIDPDHCQNVEIRNCDITCGDDAVVIKATRQTVDYGPSAHIVVKDCRFETQDSGVKIGTETTSDIHDVVFERCKIVTGSRGLTIQLRDEANVYDIKFRDIEFTSRYYADPWWGRGEAISFTAVPRTPATKLGSLHHIEVRNVTGRAENSARVHGWPGNRIHDVVFENVNLKLERWTRYKGGVYDNRPTQVAEPIEAHATPGISLRQVDGITLRACSVSWGIKVPEDFTHALEAEQVSGLQLTDFKGSAAHPERDAAILLR